MKLEAKIKKLDKEIHETEKVRRELQTPNSISTRETETESENNYFQTPLPGRKSLPVKRVKHKLGYIRGLITHMIDLVNQDPNADVNLRSELSNIVKRNGNPKSEKETPDVIKNITSIAEESEIISPIKITLRKKRSKSKYEYKRTENLYPKRRKVWKEDLEYYSNYSKNSLASFSSSYKRQKTVERDNYLSFSEKEDFRMKPKFNVPKKKLSPHVTPFFSPDTLKNLA